MMDLRNAENCDEIREKKFWKIWPQVPLASLLPISRIQPWCLQRSLRNSRALGWHEKISSSPCQSAVRSRKALGSKEREWESYRSLFRCQESDNRSTILNHLADYSISSPLQRTSDEGSQRSRTVPRNQEFKINWARVRRPCPYRRYIFLTRCNKQKF